MSARRWCWCVLALFVPLSAARASDGGWGPSMKNDAGCLVWLPQDIPDSGLQTLPDGGVIAPGGACIELVEVTFDHWRRFRETPWPTPNIPDKPGTYTPVGIPTWDAGTKPTEPFGPGDLPTPVGGCTHGKGWSWETGTWQGWAPSGIFALSRVAPVYGNNVHIDRLRPGGYVPMVNNQGMDQTIGGDYWQFSRDVNQQGSYWIGSSDRRKDWTELPGQRLSESSTGTLTSPVFVIGSDYIDFFIGGGVHTTQRVELQVWPQGSFTQSYLLTTYDGIGVSEYPPGWQNLVKTSGSWTVVRASSPMTERGSERDYLSRRVAWNVSLYKGLSARIRIVDETRPNNEPMAHVDVDHVRCTDSVAEGTTWTTSRVGHLLIQQPLWGTTDTHTHAGANISFGGHFVWGDPTDTLSQVYSCKNPLPAITLNDGGVVREAITQPSVGTECSVNFAVVLYASFVASNACALMSAGLAAIPFVGPALAAAEIATCMTAVIAATAELLASPVMTNYTLHGAFAPTSGGLDVGDWIEKLAALLGEGGDLHVSGVIEELDWDLPDGFHSGHSLGRLHQQYQHQMIRRAWQGGLRLIVMDSINGRALEGLLEQNIHYDDWEAIRDTVITARRLTACAGDPTFPAGPLCDIAAIARTPGEARRIIEGNRLAIVLGTEVDELGKPRTPQMMALFGHAGQQDSLELQLQDLFDWGIRKITPVHGIDNPLGGAGLFNDVYLTSNHFHNLTRGEDGTPAGMWVDWKPLEDFALPMSLVDPLAGLVLGTWDVGQQLLPLPQAPNAGLFQVEPVTPSDWIGGYDLITFRFGFMSMGRPLTRFKGRWGASDSIIVDQGQWIPLWAQGNEFPEGVFDDMRDRSAPLQIARLNDLGWILGEYPGGLGQSSRCTLDNVHIPLPQQQALLEAATDHYDAAQVGHYNQRGLTGQGEQFLRGMMRRGMTLDLDHLSQKARVSSYTLAGTFAQEAGLLFGGNYATFGVHSNLRGAEKTSPVPEEYRQAMGTGNETERTLVEIQHVREHGGALSPAATATVVPQALAPDVNNDCDFSSKSWAQKYLGFMKEMQGRGLTPSTDMNGLTTPAAPRFGTRACHLLSHPPSDQQAYNADPENIVHGRSMMNHWPRDFAASGCEHNTLLPAGQWSPTCPSTLAVLNQHNEASGVEYDDYAAKPIVQPVPSNPAIRQVRARSSTEVRDDTAPRAKVDEFVTVGGSRQMAPLKKFKNPSFPSPSNTGWDINLDGLKHIGLYPDFFQDVRNVGVTWEQLTPAFNASEDYIRMWEKNCSMANAWRTAHGQPQINCTSGGGSWPSP